MQWMEIEVRADGDSVRVSGRGCHGERVRERELGGGFTVRKLMSFRVQVGNAIAPVPEQARALHEATFAGELRDIYIALTSGASSFYCGG